MDSKLRNKWLLILAILAVCSWWLYPPREKLVLGPDLAGGTTLLYEVQIPEGADQQETLKRVIEVVSKRVDPDGVRNLVFQTVAGGRIQILMPHPSREVVERRTEYQDRLKELTDGNVTQGELMGALQSPPEARKQRLEKLVRGVENRRELLQEAAAKYDALRAAEEARKAAKAEAGSEKDIELADKIVDARRDFDAAVKRIDATNLDPIALSRTLDLPKTNQHDPKTHQEIPNSNPRDTELSKVIGQHPERKDQVQRLVSAHDAYFSQKRPLEDPNDLIRLLRGQGVLEFRISVDPGSDTVPDVDQLRRDLRERGPRSLPESSPMRWFVIDDINGWLGDKAQSIAQESRRPKREVLAELRKDLEADPGLFFLRHEGSQPLVGGTDGKDYYILLWNTVDRSLTQRPEQPGWQLTYATRDRDNYGRPAIGFRLNQAGANLFGILTKNNVKRRMAIVLDGRVYSAPNINEAIEHGSGIITGTFTESDINYLINTLSAGSLQAKLSAEPIEVRTIQSTLGADNLLRGLRAAGYAVAAVAIFMICYYFFGGFVANLAMLANLIIILGVMAKMSATFTLPGIAGIILNIGMCVDANVLIFERIREELRRGADMKTALRLGHDKAFSAILDSNLTTVIVCLVLGYFGTADIKGFGVTLGIGLVANLFTAVFMAHVILITWYRFFPNHRMNMLPLAAPALERALHPRVNWMAKRKVFYAASLITSLVGISLCFARGADLFDIEFRAGTEVSFDLKEGKTMTRAEVADSLKKAGVPDATVIVIDKVGKEAGASRFSVVTSESDTKVVTGAIRKALGDVINIQPVLSFKGSAAEDLAGAPVFPIRESTLGASIGRTGSQDVSEYRGGVAVVLDGLEPPTTVEDVRNRIRTMRLDPEFEKLPYRPFDVIGLEVDPARTGAYRSVVVVSRDPTIDFFGVGEERWRSELAGSEWKLIRQALTREQSFSKVSRFTPTVARTLVTSAVVAIFLSCIGIIVYLWFRFGSLRWGLAAVVALVHDVTIALGLVAISTYFYEYATPAAAAINLLPFKINMSIVAALLTIIGYSVNDTIIVFDRIRENRGKLAHITPGVIDDSVNQTLSRTFLTSGTTLLSTLMLYIFGGEAIRGFAFAMIIGVITGTYSSFAIAAPLLTVGTGGGSPEGAGSGGRRVEGGAGVKAQHA